jgi:hypothetical protein
LPVEYAIKDLREFRVRVMAAALYQRIDPKFRPSATAHAFVGLTIPELARACLNRAGATI